MNGHVKPDNFFYVFLDLPAAKDIRFNLDMSSNLRPSVPRVGEEVTIQEEDSSGVKTRIDGSVSRIHHSIVINESKGLMNQGVEIFIKSKGTPT